ncbi:hypothetical protein PAXINDRAFT_154695 [Paxillus involutus ATCC 200175]|nr:hypothetical protein PAXINDRAFT_154695 [Paxillus involutus ATCC 200175]
MSLRIKIPGNLSAEPQSQPSTSASSLTKRKSSTKRPLVYSDDEEEFPDLLDVLSEPPRVKRARTVDTDEPSSVVDPGDVEMEVDVDGDGEPIGSAADDHRFLPEGAHSLHVPIDDASPQRSPHSKEPKEDVKKHRKSASVSATTKKPRHVVYSDNDESDIDIEADFTEDDLLDEAALSFVDPDDDDDFMVHSAPKRGGSKAKAGGTSRSKSGKGQAGMLRIAKGKGSKEKDKDRVNDGDNEIFMRDERKLPVPPVTTSRASSAAAQTQVSDLFASDEATAALTTTGAASASDSTVPQPAKDTPDPSIAKKRKLPTIKKTKTPGSTVIPSSTAHKPPPPPAQEPTKSSLPTAEQRKQALTGVRDVDLADSKIYAELFNKGTGGNTPRSGLNRREKEEERRKELDKMRDEARARRAEEAKFTFDLQSQADNIARFEQRLRAENSTVLHPNFLAAKFRDEWELEKRNKRRDERGNLKREGEVS